MVDTLDFATQFGEGVDMGIEPQKAFPFIYNMVSKSDDTWVPNATPTDPDAVGSSLANYNGLGVLVDSNGARALIRTDADYEFKLLQCKFTAYVRVKTPIPPVGPHIVWWDQVDTVAPIWEYDYAQPTENVGSSLLRAIGVSLSFMHNGQYLFGGQNIDPVASGLTGPVVPVSPQTLQGFEYGRPSLHTPYLLPRQTIIQVDLKITKGLQNDAYPVCVGGMFYGMKVRV